MRLRTRRPRRHSRRGLRLGITHLADLLASLRVPCFDKTITAACVNYWSISVKGQACRFRLVGALSPRNISRQCDILVHVMLQILWLDYCLEFLFFLLRIYLHSLLQLVLADLSRSQIVYNWRTVLLHLQHLLHVLNVICCQLFVLLF